MPKVGHAVLGGTFDRFHVGHAVLLSVALREGRRVSIGLTTARFLREHPKPHGGRIQSYATRRRALERWLSRHYPRSRWRVVPLGDPLGRSVEPGVDLLVVSAETGRGANAVNAERRRRGLDALPVVVVPLLLADDLAPVSSRRIRRGVIDRYGRRRAALSVGIAADSDEEAQAAAHGLRRAIPAARPVVVGGRTLGRGTPYQRARALATRAARGRELAVGVARRPSGGWILVERSPAFALPPGRIDGRTATDLARGLARLLMRTRPQPL